LKVIAKKTIKSTKNVFVPLKNEGDILIGLKGKTLLGFTVSKYDE